MRDPKQQQEFLHIIARADSEKPEATPLDAKVPATVAKQRWMRRIPKLTRLGVVYLLAAAAVIVQANFETRADVSNLIFLISLVVLFLVLYSPALVWINLSHLQMRRRTPASVSVGDHFTLEVELRRNAKWIPAFAIEVLLEESTVMAVKHQPQVATLLAPRRWQTLRFNCVLLRRGLHKLGYVELSTSAPIGLAWFRKRLLDGDEILVHPRIATLPSWLVKRLRSIALGEGARRHFKRGDDEFYGLREFVNGDPISRLHWPTTARMGMPMVREMEAQSHNRCFIVLDVGRHPKARRVDFEHALSLVAGVSQHLSQLNVPIGFVHFGSDLFLRPPTSGRRQMMTLLDYLAISEKGEESPENWLQALITQQAGDVRWIVIHDGMGEAERMIGDSNASVMSLNVREREVNQIFVNAARASQRRGVAAVSASDSQRDSRASSRIAATLGGVV